MTIRPIIFSQDMVRALLDGRKTQTRRLATSPLRKCEPGDLLWVREHWRTESDYYNDLSPSELSGEENILYEADSDWSFNRSTGRPRRGMHMPRWASRLTLRVTRVKIEPLISISELSSEAEGVYPAATYGGKTESWLPTESMRERFYPSARSAFIALWNSLHHEQGERWEDGPAVVALTFEVIHGNVDQIARAA